MTGDNELDDDLRIRLGKNSADLVRTLSAVSEAELCDRIEGWRRAAPEPSPDGRDTVKILALLSELARRTAGISVSSSQLEATAAMCLGAVVSGPVYGGGVIATVMATLYHAIRGSIVHLVSSTKGDAARSAALAGRLCEGLTLTVRLLQPDPDRVNGAEVPAADVVCGEYSQFCLEFLIANLNGHGANSDQRPRVAVISELDFVLAERALSTPRITVAGEASHSDDEAAERVVGRLREGRHYVMGGSSDVVLTIAGIRRLVPRRPISYPDVLYARNVLDRIRQRSELPTGQARDVAAITSPFVYFSSFYTSITGIVVGSSRWLNAIRSSPCIEGLRYSASPLNPEVRPRDRLFATSSSRTSVLAETVVSEVAKDNAMLIVAATEHAASEVGDVLAASGIEHRLIGIDSEIVPSAGLGCVTVADVATCRLLISKFEEMGPTPTAGIEPTPRKRGNYSVLAIGPMLPHAIDWLRGVASAGGDGGAWQWFLAMDDAVISRYARRGSRIGRWLPGGLRWKWVEGMSATRRRAWLDAVLIAYAGEEAVRLTAERAYESEIGRQMATIYSIRQSVVRSETLSQLAAIVRSLPDDTSRVDLDGSLEILPDPGVHSVRALKLETTRSIDRRWREHLTVMEFLRSHVRNVFRPYAADIERFRKIGGVHFHRQLQALRRDLVELLKISAMPRDS